MTNSSGKYVPGLFQEPTTYRHDFTRYFLPLQASGELAKRHPVVDFTEANRSKLLKTITSHDTLQQLDYESRLPFNAMLRPKDIIGTDPRQTFCKRIIEDEGLEEAIKTRPRQYVSPAISLDNVEDKNTRKLMVDFTYMTTTSQAGKEAWSGFCPNEPSLPNTVFEKTVDPLALRLKLLPDIPAGLKISAKKWDSIQERYRINDNAEIIKNRKNTDYEKRLTNLVTAEERDEVRNLIKKNKLRLPYDKMPLSYGGFRPLFAIDVPLEVKESSPFDPNLSVSKAVTA